jgi:hypothetical protein
VEAGVEELRDVKQALLSGPPAVSKHMGIESKSHLFTMADGLSATVVWLKPIRAPENVPVTIVLDDKGKAAAAERIADRLNRGEQVLALDLAFTGEARKGETVTDLQQLVYATGARPIGMETAELIEIVRFVSNRAHQTRFALRVAAFAAKLYLCLPRRLSQPCFPS